MAAALVVRVLGPIEAVSPAGSVALGGAKQRLVLVLLALADGRVVPTDRLVDSVWGERAAPTARRTLQVYVSTLRKACAAAGIEGEMIVRDGPGYRLAVPVQALDHARFADLLAEGQRLLAEGDPARARQALRDALELWRGPALGEVADEPAVAGEAQRLEELRLVCVEERIDADLELGGHAELVAELEGLVAQHPLRERLRSELLLALYRSGRQAEALDAYRALRETLVDELGIEPGPKLHELHLRILNQDPALAAPERTVSAAPPLVRLPTPATTFIGREREVAEVVALLEREDLRLVTLTGPGGTGKTRLALQAARQSAPAFPDGVFWVPLAPLRDPAYALSAIAQALEIQEQPPAPLQDTLRESLSGRKLLLLLDNAEHLLPAIADDIALLRDVPDGPTLLVTSRERLDLQAERLYPVPTLEEHEGIVLFNDRASYLDPDRDPSDPAIAALCARLDFLPLALELAAARSDLYRPAELLSRLAGHLELLRGARDYDARHQTLQATIAWSYELLTADEQRVFRSLSVFAGGCTAEAAEQVCGAKTELLASLVQKSLLRTREAPSGRRYWMLETIREYSAGRLDEEGEGEAARERHATYCYELAVASQEGMELAATEATIEETIARLAEETDNVRAALAHGLEHDPELALRIAIALRRFLLFYRADVARDFWGVIGRALDAPSDAGDDTRASALFTAGSLAGRWLFDIEAAGRQLDLAIELLRSIGDRAQLARALNNRGGGAVSVGDWPKARSCFEESIALHKALGDVHSYAESLANLGNQAVFEGDLVVGRRALEDALHVMSSPNTMGQLALLELCDGNYGRARTLALETIEEANARTTRQQSDAPWVLALCELHGGDPDAARAVLVREVSYYTANTDDGTMGGVLFAVASYAVHTGRARESLELLGVAEELEVGRIAHEQRWRDELLAVIGTTIDSDEVAAALARGRALALPRALELAQRVLDASTSETV